MSRDIVIFFFGALTGATGTIYLHLMSEVWKMEKRGKKNESNSSNWCA